MDWKTERALDDILTEANGVKESLRDIDFETYFRSFDKTHVARHSLLIISEASRRLPDKLKERHPQIPWRKIASFGNVVRHEYEDIDDQVLWDIVKNHLDPLEDVCRVELENLRRSE